MLFDLIYINSFYAIGLVLCLLFVIGFFKWSLSGMVKLKELALEEKNQILTNFIETVKGLGAIRTLNHTSLTTHKFALTLNKAFKTDNTFHQF